MRNGRNTAFRTVCLFAFLVSTSVLSTQANADRNEQRRSHGASPWLGAGIGFLLGLAVRHPDQPQAPAPPPDTATETSPPVEATPAPPPPPWVPIEGDSYVTAYGQGIADANTLAQNVGSVSFTMDRCSATRAGLRAVNARLEKTSFDAYSIIDTILLRAAQYAWSRCPVPYAATGAFAYSLRAVKIYLPDGTLAVEAFRLQGDTRTGPGTSYAWHSVRNFFDERRAKEAQDAAVAKAAEDARLAAEQAAQTAQRWLFAKIGAGLALLLWMFVKRDAISRLFYSLTPHPAAAMVDAAIRTGAPLDGVRFAQLTDDLPDGTPKMEVRAAQARALAAKWQRHEDTLNARQVDILAAERERVARENVFLQAQNDLRSAAVAHEQASARLNMLRQG